MWVENPGDAISPAGDGSAAAAAGGSTPAADASGDFSDFVPEVRVALVIPLDGTNVPYIDEPTGVADWLVEAAMSHLLDRMRTEDSTEIELTPNCDTEEDE